MSTDGWGSHHEQDKLVQNQGQELNQTFPARAHQLRQRRLQLSLKLGLGLARGQLLLLRHATQRQESVNLLILETETQV